SQLFTEFNESQDEIVAIAESVGSYADLNQQFTGSAGPHRARHRLLPRDAVAAVPRLRCTGPAGLLLRRRVEPGRLHPELRRRGQGRRADLRGPLRPLHTAVLLQQDAVPGAGPAGGGPIDL